MTEALTLAQSLTSEDLAAALMMLGVFTGILFLLCAAIGVFE
jgi:hypothetical protein